GLSVPVMDIQGNSTSIVPGDTTPSNTDDTDFGSAELALSYVTKTFTINNSGSAVLNLTGTPKVKVDGPAKLDFTVLTQPSATVAAVSGGTPGGTTFSVKFRPTAGGARVATITVPTNDPVNPNYTFTVKGVGLHQPVIAVQGKNVTIVGDGTNTAG